VYPDFSKLQPGTIQRGTITLQFADGNGVRREVQAPLIYARPPKAHRVSIILVLVPEREAIEELPIEPPVGHQAINQFDEPAVVCRLDEVRNPEHVNERSGKL
jgi:hypothetical protein